MVKLFTSLAKLVFIANYGISSVAFNYYLNHYDFGEWDSDGWDIMLIGGLIAGILALLLELHLYRKLEFWPKSLALFLARQIFCGIAFIVLGFTIASCITIAMGFVHGLSDVIWFVVIPFGVAIYLPMLAPFGIVVGLINGVLFRIVHMIQTQNRLVENP